jgi:preprotein translocase subunit YajC
VLDSPIVPIVLVAAMFWFVWVLPARDERRVKDFQASLVKDDQIVTTGGLHGRVVAVEADTVTLEVGDRTRIVVDRSSVGRRAAPKAG